MRGFAGVLGLLAALGVVVLIGLSYVQEMWGSTGVAVVMVSIGLIFFMLLILAGGFAFVFGIARVLSYSLGTSIANAGRQSSADAAYYRLQAQMERNRMLTDKQAAQTPTFGTPARQWGGDVEDGNWAESQTEDGWVLS